MVSTPPPGRGQEVRWGILGTGTIAAAMAEGIHAAPDARLVAVGSRTAASADRFGDRFSVARRHASYAALCADPEVDVVYVATPHALHHPNTIEALRAGKHVLCEKPLAINALQALDMIREARERGLFLMEAMWTRTAPLVTELARRIADGAIGEVRLVAADFGFREELDPSSILFDPAMGGGSLLDVGVYPVSFAHLWLGAPDHVSAHAALGPTGVDHTTVAVLAHDSGAAALVSSSIELETPWTAELVGTRGRVTLPRPWWRPERAVITNALGIAEWLEAPMLGNGYAHEVMEVGRCLLESRLESPLVSHDSSLAVMTTLDRIRACIGLRYPMETSE